MPDTQGWRAAVQFAAWCGAAWEVAFGPTAVLATKLIAACRLKAITPGGLAEFPASVRLAQIPCVRGVLTTLPRASLTLSVQNAVLPQLCAPARKRRTM